MSMNKEIIEDPLFSKGDLLDKLKDLEDYRRALQRWGSAFDNLRKYLNYRLQAAHWNGKCLRTIFLNAKDSSS